MLGSFFCLLSSGRFYHRLEGLEPSSSTEKSLNKLLLQIKDQPAPHDSDKKRLEPKLYHKLHSTDSTPASFYGLPKIDKDNVPLRPIMSAIESPTYELSKYLANILSPLPNNKYTVKNSAFFVEKIRTMSVDPDEILVSFDVVSLFTCIPTHLAIDVVKERLDFDQSLPERTNLSIQNIIALLKFVLDNNFFVFQGDHFKQIFGCPIGSPVSAIFANLVMEYVEEKALLLAPNPPKWWFRYVDDSHVCIKREHVDEFHSHLNSINTNIKFTIETESEGSIAFLDTKTTRQDDGSITVSVYRKATHTDPYFDFKSHHHPQHKYSVVCTLMDRAKNIPSTEEEALRETKRVAEALTANNYPANFIYNGRQLNRQQEVNDTGQRGMVFFCPTPKDSLRESRGFFEVLTLRSLTSLFGQSQTYLKNQKTGSRGRLPEELCIRSNAKIVIVFTSVRHRAR